MEEIKVVGTELANATTEATKTMKTMTSGKLGLICGGCTAIGTAVGAVGVWLGQKLFKNHKAKKAAKKKETKKEETEDKEKSE